MCQQIAPRENEFFHSDFWKPVVISYLNAKDTLNFCSTCKHVKNAVGLRVLKPTPLSLNKGRWMGGHSDGDVPRYFQELKLFVRNRIHTVILSYDWRDQGWGNMKGKLIVCEDSPNRRNSTARMEFNDDKVVCESPIATHRWEKLTLQFEPKDDRSYHLWFAVGGGGGHELFVKNMTMKYLIYDRNGAICQQYDALLMQRSFKDGGFFFPRLLKSVAELLLNRSKEDDSMMMMRDVLEDAGLSVDRSSLEALVLLASEMEEMKMNADESDQKEGNDQVYHRDLLDMGVGYEYETQSDDDSSGAIFSLSDHNNIHSNDSSEGDPFP